MKKANRILCALLVAVMLLGALPAYAATPMTAAASLIALPLGGKLFTALPVEKIESTYSAVLKSAQTSTPVTQTTSASPTSLPDGTTGATVGLNGITSGKRTEIFNDHGGPYNVCYWKSIDSLKSWNCARISKPRPYDPSKPVFTYLDKSRVTPADLVGFTFEEGMLIDVFTYDPSTGIYTFLCQYDTRGTGDFTIQEPPAVWASKAPTRTVTSFNDVNPGDWYYEAVTALAQGGVIHTVFDTDPNGNFNPNALIKDSEVDFIKQRLIGKNTEGLTMNTSLDKADNPNSWVKDINALTNTITRDCVIYDILLYRGLTIAQPSAAPTQTDTRAADRDAIAKFVVFYSNDKTHRKYWNESVNKCRAIVQDYYAKADALNLIRTPGTPDVIDFDARITRAEYCVLLYRAGLTSFGCCDLAIRRGS